MTGVRDDLDTAEERIDEALSKMRGDMATAVEELQRSLEAKDATLEEQATKDREVSDSVRGGMEAFGVCFLHSSLAPLYIAPPEAALLCLPLLCRRPLPAWPPSPRM